MAESWIFVVEAIADTEHQEIGRIKIRKAVSDMDE
jgi:hypothetical protein